MMGVYLPNMEMPTRCWDCLLNTYGYCMASDEHSDIIPSDAPIPEWCPLVPVPPLGRLIDADALMIDLMDRGIEGIQTDDWHEIQQTVDDAPTIIPAEEGE